MPDRIESFSLFHADFDGHPLVANIDLGLRSCRDRTETPWFLSLSTPLIHSTAEGFPTKEEASILNQWEDVVDELIARQSKFAFVGRVTWNGHRELLYYIDKPEPLVQELQRFISERKTRPFAFRCKKDADWKDVGIYLD